VPPQGRFLQGVFVITRILSFAVALALVTGLTPVFGAAEGVLIVQKLTSGSNTQTANALIEKTRMRADVVDARGSKQSVMFDGTKQVMTLVDTNRRTYSELTKADLEGLRAQMDSAMSAMQAQLANLPAEQRAQVEAMMRGRGMGAPVKTEYRRAGTDTVGRWTCDKYEGFRDGTKSVEVCTVAPSALGFTMADFAVTRELAKFFASLMPQMADQIAAVGTIEEQGYAGFPVKHVTLGSSPSTMEVTEASRKTFTDADFAVPEGFRKEDMMRGRGRGGDAR
jgi:hypothetical protein